MAGVEELTDAVQEEILVYSFGDILWRRHVEFPSEFILIFFDVNTDLL